MLKLAHDIRNDLPKIKGFLERNLKRMLAFYHEYQGLQFGPTPLAQLPEEGYRSAYTRLVRALKIQIADS
jgi:hypothetical protein